MSLKLKHNITEDTLTQAVLGRNQSVARKTAIKMLHSSMSIRALDTLHRIVENDEEPSNIRRLAAIKLWQSNNFKARDYLLKTAMSVKDPKTLLSIVKVLGRIGDRDALPTILEIKERSEGLLSTHASFAASLISYRLNLKGNDLQTEILHAEIPVTSRRHRLSFVVPPQSEMETFKKSMSNEPYGIEFSNSLQQFTCPGGTWMLGFNREVINQSTIQTLQSRKTFMGMIAAKHTDNDDYSASFLILTAPQADTSKVDIFVTRATGALALTGILTINSPEQANFSINAVARRGVAPMSFEGTISSMGDVAFSKGLSTDRVGQKNHPFYLGLEPV